MLLIVANWGKIVLVKLSYYIVTSHSLEIIYCAPRPARAEVTVDYSIESSVMRCLPDLNHVHGLVQYSFVTFHF